LNYRDKSLSVRKNVHPRDNNSNNWKKLDYSCRIVTLSKNRNLDVLFLRKKNYHVPMILINLVYSRKKLNSKIMINSIKNRERSKRISVLLKLNSIKNGNNWELFRKAVKSSNKKLGLKSQNKNKIWEKFTGNYSLDSKKLKNANSKRKIQKSRANFTKQPFSKCRSKR